MDGVLDGALAAPLAGDAGRGSPASIDIAAISPYLGFPRRRGTGRQPVTAQR
ncbi:MAG: hypothetical protein ACRYF2_16460 [Janthinobacterium lividum]